MNIKIICNNNECMFFEDNECTCEELEIKDVGSDKYGGVCDSFIYHSYEYALGEILDD